ncbi:hypothetical protein D5272_08585 [bacterium D16-76]|nr:hypothetical protein [bacterium D16-76]
MFGNVLLIVCCWICAAIFLGIALFARRYKKPMWFWSGSKVDPASIANISSYNRANSRMWTVFSLPFWASGLLAFWWPGWAGILMAAACLGGLPVLIFVYQKIYKKYKADDYE